MSTTIKLAILSIFIVLSGRLHAQEEPTKWDKMGFQWNTDAFITVKKKENFRTGCDTSSIKLTILETLFESKGGDGAYGNGAMFKKQKRLDKIKATSIGVEGCGQKSVYIITNGGWLLNSESGEKK